MGTACSSEEGHRELNRPHSKQVKGQTKVIN